MGRTPGPRGSPWTRSLLEYHHDSSPPPPRPPPHRVARHRGARHRILFPPRFGQQHHRSLNAAARHLRDFGWLGAARSHHRLRRRRARVQLLLPATRRNVRDARPAELGGAHRFPGHCRDGQPTLGAGQAAHPGGCRTPPRSRGVVRPEPEPAAQRQRPHRQPGSGQPGGANPGCDHRRLPR